MKLSFQRKSTVIECMTLLAGYDRASNDARNVSQDIKDGFQDTKRDAKKAWYDTKDSVKDNYRDAKDSVKDSYRETKDSIKDKYNETNRELNRSIDQAKQSWRDSLTPHSYVRFLACMQWRQLCQDMYKSC